MVKLQTPKSASWLVGFLVLLIGGLPFLAQAETPVVDTREALIEVFDVTLGEIDNLLAKDRLMLATMDKDEDIADLAVFHAATLNGYAQYVNLLKEQATNSLTTLDELKNMASEFKSWRVQYDTQTKEIFDLLLFLQARAILGTANSRLALIASDVKKINAVASKADAKSLSQLLAGAQKNLASARISQQNAKTGLLILQAKHLAPPSEDEEIETTNETLLKDLKDVFSRVSITYKEIFFVMSSIAQKY